MTYQDQTPSPRGGMFRHALIFGGLAGGAVIIWNLLEYAFGVHGEHLSIRPYTATASLVFPIGAIACGIMRWRDLALGGAIRFSQAFGCALAIGLVFAASVALFSWIYVAAINPAFIDTLIANQAALMEKGGSSAEEVQKAVADARAAATPSTYAFAIFAQMLLSVFVVALFASVIVRRRS